MLSLEEGAELIKLARKVIMSKFSLIKSLDRSIDKAMKEKFSDSLGCFVTLHKKGQLRGCIGYPEPIMPLSEGIISAAKHAAFNDPRFPPVEKEEMEEITIEVSVLTKPKRVDVRDSDEYLKKIKIGKDGIIIRSTFSSGLLLPQVATEHNWDTKTFLSQTCLKANLQADDWRDFDLVRVYKFQSQVFGETTPEGEVIQVM
jgi:hypothetical protein